MKNLANPRKINITDGFSGVLLFIFALVIFSACSTRAPKSERETKSVLIDTTIRTKRDQFITCFEKSSSFKSKIKGHIFIQFLILPLGQVKDPSITKSDLHDPDFEDCVIAVFKKIKFPKHLSDSKPEVPITVQYPLNFSGI